MNINFIKKLKLHKKFSDYKHKIELQFFNYFKK